MYKRRDVLKLGVAGVAGSAFVSSTGVALAQAAPSPAVDATTSPAPTTFDASQVADAARAFARRPYKAPADDLPDPFANLTFEQYAAIHNKPSGVIWSNDNLGFAIEPLHRGFLFTTPMQIAVVEGGHARQLVYNTADFDLGALKPTDDVKDIGFSGFRVLQTRKGEPPVEVAVFQGASFFKAVATGQGYGVKARGLAIRTADPKGEEFPIFRAVWIEQPNLATGALVIHALLDSDSVTGSYQFTLRAGDATIIDTECTLFARVAVDHVGIGAMSATYAAGPLDRRRADDFRPNVYEASGLQILNGRGEWLWRPVANRATLQVSAFVDKNPRGFGVLQRERDFARFLDDDNHWERRPSLWVEPIGDWGPGSVSLVEIPTDSDVNQNTIAYWRPDSGLAAGSETSYAYRQFWCWNPPTRPPGATVTLSRSGRGAGGSNSRRRRFLVEFTGDIFAEVARDQDHAPNLSAASGTISSIRTFITRDRKTFRVLFDLDPGSETLCELRLLLEAQGKPMSEIWLYRWTP